MFQIREAVGGSQIFFKIGPLKNFANFTGKHLCWSPFFNIVAGLKRSVTFLKRDSNPGVFWEICEVFKNTFFYRTPPVAASETKDVFNFQCFCYDYVAFCLNHVALQIKVLVFLGPQLSALRPQNKNFKKISYVIFAVIIVIIRHQKLCFLSMLRRSRAWLSNL